MFMNKTCFICQTSFLLGGRSIRREASLKILSNKKPMAFLRQKSCLGVQYGDLFSAFQKACRWAEKEEDFGADGLAFYAARQFSPSALKKRLVACAIEDMPYLNLLLQLIKLPETSLDLLLPWVQVLCMIPKTHDAAWLQRISLESAKNLSDPCLGNDIVHQAARMTRMVLDKDLHPVLLKEMDPNMCPSSNGSRQIYLIRVWW